MTERELLELAGYTGFVISDTFGPMAGARPVGELLQRFAAMVAAKEREACAQVCESWADEHDYAGAIRQRGQA